MQEHLPQDSEDDDSQQVGLVIFSLYHTLLLKLGFVCFSRYRASSLCRLTRLCRWKARTMAMQPLPGVSLPLLGVAPLTVGTFITSMFKFNVPQVVIRGNSY